jgi:hypothetical protein
VPRTGHDHHVDDERAADDTVDADSDAADDHVRACAPGLDTIDSAEGEHPVDLATRERPGEPSARHRSGDPCTRPSPGPAVNTEQPATSRRSAGGQRPPDPELRIIALSSVCRRDVPYVVVTFSGDASLNGRSATITFVDVDGKVVATHTVTFQSGTTMQYVYPGAAVDGAGNPVDWPGWVFDGDDWVPDPTDARLRCVTGFPSWSR